MGIAKKFTDEYIINKYKEVREKLGKHPSGDEFQRMADISQQTVRTRFGSYAMLVERAGYKISGKLKKKEYVRICANCGRMIATDTWGKGKFFCTPSCKRAYSLRHKTYTDYLKEAMKKEPELYSKNNYNLVRKLYTITDNSLKTHHL